MLHLTTKLFAGSCMLGAASCVYAALALPAEGPDAAGMIKPLVAPALPPTSPSDPNADLLTSFTPTQTRSSFHLGERVSPWLKLAAGKTLETTFVGEERAIGALQSGALVPTTQAAADMNGDGYADLISGFRTGDGLGLIALHRARKEAFEPKEAPVLADLRRGVFPASFEKDAQVFDLSAAPDFIVAGSFSAGSPMDLVFAAQGGRSLYLMTADGKGGFHAPQEIAVEGAITALASAKIDFSQTYAGVVVAVSDGNTSHLLVFDGRTELTKATPRAIAVDRKVEALILSRSDLADATVDLFGLAEGGIFTVYDIARAEGGVNQIALPFRVVDFAVGEFIADRRGTAEIAVLSEDGAVTLLQHGALDTRPYASAEMREFFQREGRGQSSLIKPQADNAALRWTQAEVQALGLSIATGKSVGSLRKASLTGNETDDLLVVNRAARRVQILFREPHTEASPAVETKLQTVEFASAPAAILPMRLNVMGQQGFVVFNEGSMTPTPVLAVPNATFVVSKTPDTNDGACNADCSLREAIVAANAAAGADMITFAPNGTFQLTIAGANENAAATGDLDITQALTIVGNGTANTIVQAGSTASNGIDKVFSVNPAFNAAFATSISGLTMRFGRNPSTFNGDGFGGGLDWDGVANGTITMSNVNVESNTALDGRGGGLVFTTGASGSGVALTNVNVTNNIASRTVSSNGTAGGGIFVGFGTPFSLTTGSISNNQTTGTNNNGGGLFIFAIGASSGNSNLSGVTVSNNVSQDRGGGIYTERGLTLTAPTIISNNSVGINGGGLSMNVFMSSVNLSKATLTGNSSGTSGGAIDVGSQTGANGNILNMSFSRVAGNTGAGFTGVVTRGGTANIENNWWGCNGGPGAAGCNTAGTSGGGSVDFDPWLRFTHAASPGTIVVGQGSTLTASFLTNSNGQAIAASNLDALVGVPIAFNTAVRGTISGAQGTIQSNGTATATFTATSAGAGAANAVVDNGTMTASLTINQASTTTAITSANPDPSVRGQSITVTYTVTPQAGGTPTGNVTVSDGVNSCVGTAAAGSCNVALTTVGNRTLTATYAGDANFTGSVSPGASHTVNKANTTAVITAESADPTTQGQAFTVFYTVSATAPGSGTPTGNVTVSDGVDSCVGTVAAGQCSLVLNTSGARTLTATYAGDASFNGAVSPGEPHSVTVSVQSTTTTITSDNPDPSVRGQSITVTYTVAPQSSGTPTGSVTVSDGVNSCVGTVSAGSCNVALTTVGNRTLTATYAGDANYTGSVSAGVAHTVNKANTSTTITAESADPTTPGQTFTAFYTVGATAPGTGTPTGNVTVSDGVESCTGTAAAGQCSLALNTVGARTLTATYAGDGSFDGSVSPGEPHTVLGQAPAITSAASTTFTVGAAGSFTVTTSGNPNATITRGGDPLPPNLTFNDNGNGTGTLSGTPAPGTGGVYNLTFTATNGTSPDATQNFTLTVNEAPAITSANSATFMVGTAGSFTVTTSGFPAPALTRGGAALPFNLSFTDNGNGTGTLSGTPASGTGGVYNISFTATNGSGAPTQNFTLTVNEAPVITSANNATFTIGNFGSFTVTRTGFPAPSVSQSGALPSGVSFTASVLSGTPANGSVGTYPLQFTATNGIGSDDVQNFSLTVNDAICLAAPTNLTAWFPGEGDATDVIGGRNGTAMNGAGFASGKVGQGFSFNGGSSQVSVPDDTAWDFGANDFTIETWVKFNAPTSEDVLIGHSNGSGSVNKWIFWRKNGALAFHLEGSAVANITSNVAFTPTVGQWYHVAVARSGNTYRFYVDGAQNGIDQFDSNVVPDASAPLTLGRAEALTALNGMLDEVQIFNRALTGAEITSVYNASIKGLCFDAPAALSAVSRKTHTGVGDFDVPLPLTGTAGVECRTGGANGDYKIVVTFNNVVTAGSASVSAGSVLGSPTFSGNAMTINLTGVTNAQALTVSLSNVKDGFGQTLPSVLVPMDLLLADVNANRSVNASDISQVKANSGGSPVTGLNFRNDVNADGSIGASDISMTKATAGTVIP